ncbi:hypothetical protein [Peribacillus simplex]|uniref:hypothetical protein n=1 Tax=Peribacillus simplex TaxID=1478 RepID=UPI003D28EF3C
MKNYNADAKNFLEGLSRDELKELLMDAGFEVEDGPGEIIIEEQLEAEVHFSVKGSVETATRNNYLYVAPRQVSISYPRAS